MHVLGIAAQKGGAGKTTLSIHLAVIAKQKGLSVILADTDPQKSASKWAGRRNVEEPTVVTVSTKQLPALINDAQSNDFDLVIVDSAPSHSGDIVDIAKAADFCVIPSKPAILDLDAIGDTVMLFAHTDTKAGIVLNGCPVGRGGEASITREARKALQGAPVPVSPISITNRAALSHALIDGRAVIEYEPKSKASKELNSLWDWISEQLEKTRG